MNTQVVEYSPTAAGLTELRSRLRNVVYDVETTAGMDRARKDRRECVTLRTSLEELRVRIKAPALERCRLIDSEAKRITSEIVALEQPIDDQIKAVEQRKAAEKAAREQAERERMEVIGRKVQWIRLRPVECVGKSADDIDEVITMLSSLPIDAATYAELLPVALVEREAAIEKLSGMLEAAASAEAVAAQLAAEREALERQRAEQDAAAAAERARIAEEARVALEARDAADAAAKAERDAADAKAKAERDEADRAAREAREAEERRVAGARAALEAAERELMRERVKAAEDSLSVSRTSARVDAFVAAAEGYKFAAPGVETLEALVRLTEMYAQALADQRIAA